MATLSRDADTGAKSVWLVRGRGRDVHLHGACRGHHSRGTLVFAFRSTETGRCGAIEFDGLVDEAFEAGVWKYIHRLVPSPQRPWPTVPHLSFSDQIIILGALNRGHICEQVWNGRDSPVGPFKSVKIFTNELFALGRNLPGYPDGP